MIRVLLADDHEIVRLGLRAVLESADDIEVIGEVATAEAAIAAAQAGGIDVILMDLRFGPGVEGTRLATGADATAEIKRTMEKPPHVLVVTNYDTDADIDPGAYSPDFAHSPGVGGFKAGGVGVVQPRDWSDLIIIGGHGEKPPGAHLRQIRGAVADIGGGGSPETGRTVRRCGQGRITGPTGTEASGYSEHQNTSQPGRNT